jgi:hypothetical protein
MSQAFIIIVITVSKKMYRIRPNFTLALLVLVIASLVGGLLSPHPLPQHQQVTYVEGDRDGNSISTTAVTRFQAFIPLRVNN